MKEISFGEWAGLTWPEIEAGDPEAYARRQADRWNAAPPEGQSHRDVYQLVMEWLTEVTSDSIVVAHHGTARYLRGHFLKLAPAEILDLDVPQDNVLVIEGGRLTWL